MFILLSKLLISVTNAEIISAVGYNENNVKVEFSVVSESVVGLTLHR